jgi:hypothetical protein
MRARYLVLFATCSVLLTTPAFALDDAELLSRRVPGQRYQVLDVEICALQFGNALWGIPIWACDPATLTITKVLGSSAPAPYAITITTRPNDPMEEISSGRHLTTIHLLAASLEDAIKMRRALIKEIEVMQRHIERRQGNPPGYLKSVVRRSKP